MKTINKHILKYLKWWFLCIGLIFIYLLLNNFLNTYYFESFETIINQSQNQTDNQTDNHNLKKDLMSILNISNERIQNIKVINETDENNFQIEFEILPRKLGQTQEPTLTQIKENLSLKINDLNFPTITHNNNQKILAHFNFYEIPLHENTQTNTQPNTQPNSTSKNTYINPSYQAQRKYLTYLESGFHYDPEIDRTYKLDNNAKIYLEPLPTLP